MSTNNQKVLEYALLVAKLASAKSAGERKKIEDKLASIEAELKKTPEQIANEAMAIYNKSYN